MNYHITAHFLLILSFDESNRLNNSYRLAEIYQVDIAHAFTEQFNATIALALNNDQFITPENHRKEDYLSSSIALHYQRSENFNFHLRYQYKSLDANYADIDYQHNKKIWIAVERTASSCGDN